MTSVPKTKDAAPSKPVLEAFIPLRFPVPVKDADGKDAKRDSIVVNRPKAKHGRRLAALLGADLIKGIVAMLPPEATEAARAGKSVDVDLVSVLSELLPQLLTDSRIGEVFSILADMCDEAPELIDELDLVDLVAVGKAVIGFFPSIQSLGSTGTPPT